MTTSGVQEMFEENDKYLRRTRNLGLNAH